MEKSECFFCFFFSSRRRHTRSDRDWSSDVCSSDLPSKVYSKELIELIFMQPYCKIQFLVEFGIAKRQTASEYLQELEKIGVLVAERQGREILYKHPALLEVLAA